jgi:hypothetical protein
LQAGSFFQKSVEIVFAIVYNTGIRGTSVCAFAADGRRNGNRFEGSFAANKHIGSQADTNQSELSLPLSGRLIV